jgi:hypothetical protein
MTEISYMTANVRVHGLWTMIWLCCWNCVLVIFFSPLHFNWIKWRVWEHFGGSDCDVDDSRRQCQKKNHLPNKQIKVHKNLDCPVFSVPVSVVNRLTTWWRYSTKLTRNSFGGFGKSRGSGFVTVIFPGWPASATAWLELVLAQN